MSPELEIAIKERIALGHNQDQITAEMKAAGYDDDTIQQVYLLLTTDTQLTAIPTPQPGELIGFWALVTNTFSLVVTHWRLLLISSVYGLGALALLAALVGVAVMAADVSTALTIVLAVVIAVIAFVVILLLSFGFQRALLRRNEQLSYYEHLRFLFPHILSIFLVSLYVQFATSLGFLLLYIPGIILSVYLGYALLVRIDDKATGIKALVRSAELVRGRWWGTFGRMIFATIVFVLATIPLFVVFGLLWLVTESVSGGTLSALFADGVNSTGAFMLVIVIGLVAVAALLAIAFLVQCAMTLLYESLRDTAVPLEPTKEKRLYFWMKVIVVLGIPAAIILNIGNTMSTSDTSWNEIITEPTEFQQSAADEQAAIDAELEAFMEEFEAELDLN